MDERIRAYWRNYWKQNRWRQHRRKVMLGKGKFTHLQWLKIIAEQNSGCKYCDKEFTEKFKPTIDHIIPLVRGGTHIAKNIAAACRQCNSMKNGLIPKQLKKKGYTLGGRWQKNFQPMKLDEVRRLYIKTARAAARKRIAMPNK